MISYKGSFKNIPEYLPPCLFLWVGTYLGGVNFYNGNLTTFVLHKKEFADPFSLSHNIVTSFVEDDKGNIWVGTDGGGLI